MLSNHNIPHILDFYMEYVKISPFILFLCLKILKNMNYCLISIYRKLSKVIKNIFINFFSKVIEIKISYFFVCFFFFENHFTFQLCDIVLHKKFIESYRL